MIVALALGALAGPTEEIGLYTGAVLVGPNHELYESTPTSTWHELGPGVPLGFRAGVYPIDFLGGEVELHAAFAPVKDSGSGMMSAIRGQAVVRTPEIGSMGLRVHLAGGGGVWGVSSGTDALGKDTDRAYHVGPGASLGLGETLRLRLDYRHLFTAKRGVGDGEGGGSNEILLGLSMEFGGGPAPERDLDSDGFTDENDGCAEEPETVNRFSDADGCPDKAGAPTVTITNPNGDPLADVPITVDGKEVGKTDALGRITVEPPLEAGTQLTLGANPARKTGTEFLEPVSYTVPDGGSTVALPLVWRPGAIKVVTRADGKPILGSVVSLRGPVERDDEPLGDDGQEIFVLEPGAWTLLISAETFGTERRDVQILPDQRSLVLIEVQMKPAEVQVQKQEVVILDQVKFGFDSDQIDSASYGLLNEVANNLVAHPEIKRVEVQGHTDDKGSDKYNKELSQRRMDAVVAFLVQKGVERSRLVPVGFGEACPLVANDSEAGRASNRRVQFIITEPAPEGGIPCH